MIPKEQLISIVTAAQRGEENAVSELYNTFYMDLHYYIMKTVKDSELAADLTQDTFIEILQTIQSLREPAAFPIWSRRIAYHKCTAHFRKRKDVLETENEEGVSVFDNLVEERDEFIPDEALDKAELKQAIRAILDELPEEQRSAIMMRYFDEIPVKDIALIQGVSEGTVKSRLNYARKAIKQAVKEYEKKTGVKLHIKGIVPLLLWLFREYRIANDYSATKEAVTATVTSASFKTVFAKVAACLTATVLVTGSLWTKEPEPVAEEFQSMNDVMEQKMEFWHDWDGFEGEDIPIQMLGEIVEDSCHSFYELEYTEQVEDVNEREDYRKKYYGLTDISNVKWAIATEMYVYPSFYAMILQVNDVEAMESIINQIKDNIDPYEWNYYPYDAATDTYGDRTVFWSGVTIEDFQFYVNQDYLLVTYADPGGVERGLLTSSEEMQKTLDGLVRYRESLEQEEN